VQGSSSIIFVDSAECAVYKQFLLIASDEHGVIMNQNGVRIADSNARRSFIGGSDARIIMGQDEKALIRLWQEKRGEIGPEDLSSAP
jgi:hypothetical protein